MRVPMLSSDIRSLPLAALTFSQTPAQIERRKGFSQEKLQELADSIKSEGLLQPIVVRPASNIDVIDAETTGRWYPAHRNGIGRHNKIGTGFDSKEEAEDAATKLRDEAGFEVVAGERRVRASKIVGKEEILASVRDLSDQQVAKIQLIENLQREDVHPLAEAEGYEELLKKHGYSVDQIAAETGKSKAYIYARVKLLALDPSSRKFFQENKLSASTALLIARIPVASLQRQAAAEIVNPRHGEPMSYRDALDYIQHEYMLRLEEAPFPTDRDGLVRNVGPCGSCPKRTGNQPQLFEDIKGADVCTDPTCFKAKREAWSKQQLAEAKEKGTPVITGKRAAQIKPHEHSGHLAEGYTRLDEKCWEDPKHRTYKQILGKEAKPTLLQAPKTGELLEIVQKAVAIKKLKTDGVIKPSKGASGSSGEGAKYLADKKESAALENALLLAIHAKAPKKLDRGSLERLVEHELDVVGTLPDVLETAWSGDSHQAAIYGRVEKLTEPQLHQLLWELLLVNELSGGSEYNVDKLLNLAKVLKIDVKAIRAKVDAEQKTSAPAKAPKKKAPK